MARRDAHRVTIVGGGFGGLYAAKNLRRDDVEVTLVDRRNFHLFQPLLYQVATGGLSPGDISSPLRGIFKDHRNTRVWQAVVTDIDVKERRVVLSDGSLPYDTLIVASGGSYSYFGNEHWAPEAPGLKSVEDALEIRHRIFVAFERAEREPDPDRRQALLTFAVIGAGPTGVELSGALAELAYGTLRRDFRRIDPRDSVILLIEGAARVLPSYPPKLSARAERALQGLGVTVHKNTMVTRIDNGRLTLRSATGEASIEARTILWAAGVKASSLGRSLADKTGAKVDPVGRLVVEPDLTLPHHPEIFIVGDLALFAHPSDSPLPGVAPVAMQQGHHAAEVIKRRLDGKTSRPFVYKNKGNLAVIGRRAAVADLGRWRFSGHLAWLVWVFVHIRYLIEFDNKLIVMIQWAFDYFTRKRGARLITGKDPHPLSSHALPDPPSRDE